MQPRLLFQTAILLFLGQAVLGLLGALTVNVPWLPWAGLILPVLLTWLVVRTAEVFRTEMAQALKLGHALVPWRVALFVAVFWQLVGTAVGLFGPGAISTVWQGVLTPPFELLVRYRPDAAVAGDWLWLAGLLEIALFTWVAGQAAVKRRQPQLPVAPVKQAAAAGEWAPARRRRDIPKRVKLEPPGDE